MKYLEANAKGPEGENKMQPGNRADQGGTTMSAPIGPKAQKLAKDLKVDLSSVKGTGRNGMVTEFDVRKFAASSAQVSLTLPIDKA